MFMDVCLSFQIGDNDDMESQNYMNVPPVSSAAAETNIDSLGKMYLNPKLRTAVESFLKYHSSFKNTFK